MIQVFLRVTICDFRFMVSNNKLKIEGKGKYVSANTKKLQKQPSRGVLKCSENSSSYTGVLKRAKIRKNIIPILDPVLPQLWSHLSQSSEF